MGSLVGLLGNVKTVNYGALAKNLDADPRIVVINNNCMRLMKAKATLVLGKRNGHLKQLTN